jgi:hypothetical protein
MTWTEREFELVDLNSEVTSAPTESHHTWIKPVFEFDDLCCEVTMYLYNRR